MKHKTFDAQGNQIDEVHDGRHERPSVPIKKIRPDDPPAHKAYYEIPEVPTANLGTMNAKELETLKKECTSRFRQCIDVRDIAQENSTAILELKSQITLAEIALLEKLKARKP